MPKDRSRNEKMERERLLAAISGDDPTAFRELYERYSPNLRHGVRAQLARNPRLVPHEEDIISRAWLRLLANERKLLRSYDPDRAAFGSFMAMVGANTAWQVAALKGHPTRNWSGDLDEQALVETSGEADVEVVVADREILARLDAELVAGLNDYERYVLEASIIEGRSAKEVAAELGKSEGAVWTAASRLRKKISDVAQSLRDPKPSSSNKEAGDE